MDLWSPLNEMQWPINSNGIPSTWTPTSSQVFSQYPDSQLPQPFPWPDFSFDAPLQFPADLPPIDEEPPMTEEASNPFQVYTPVQREIPKLTEQLTQEENNYVLNCIAALREEPNTIESSELFLETLLTRAPESLKLKIREYLKVTR